MKFNEQPESAPRKFITGPVVINNLLVNPTLKELKEYGVGWLDKEQEYVIDNERGKSVAINIWAKTADDDAIILNWKFFISNELWVSQTGKDCYINDLGRTSWVENESDLPDWFVTAGCRKAHKGEDLLCDLFTAFNNAPYKKGEFTSVLVTNMDKMLKGDFSEIRGMNKLPKNKIKVIVAVHEANGKLYHQVYSRKVLKHWETKTYVQQENDKGYMELDEFINYIINVDPNSKFNPEVYSTTPMIRTTEEINKLLDDGNAYSPENIPTSDGGAEDLPLDDLPF